MIKAFSSRKIKRKSKKAKNKKTRNNKKIIRRGGGLMKIMYLNNC
jgi:hypothetical protein